MVESNLEEEATLPPTQPKADITPYILSGYKRLRVLCTSCDVSYLKVKN